IQALALDIDAATGQTFTNSGSLALDGVSTSAIDVAVDNTGSIEEVQGTLTFNGDVLNEATGFIKSFDGGLVTFMGALQNYGTVTPSPAASVFDDPVSNFDGGHIEVGADSSVTFYGALHNAGSITVDDGGFLFIGGLLDGDGTFAVDGGTVEFAGGVAAGVTL